MESPDHTLIGFPAMAQVGACFRMEVFSPKTKPPRTREKRKSARKAAMNASDQASASPAFVLLGDPAVRIVRDRVLPSGELVAGLWNEIREPRLGTWLYADELAAIDYQRASRAGSQQTEYAAKKLTDEMKGLYLLHRHFGSELRPSPLFEGFLKYRGSEIYAWRKVNGDRAFERTREFIEWPSAVCIGVTFKDSSAPRDGAIKSVDRITNLALRFLFCPAFDDEGGVFWFGQTD